MKNILLLVLVVGLSSCGFNVGKSIDGVEQFPTDNFSIKLLFEVEDVKVYRFYDMGQFRYFTIGGKFQPHVQSSSSGGTTTTWVDGAEQ